MKCANTFAYKTKNDYFCNEIMNMHEGLFRR